jgi:hypothetical protein
MAKNELDVEIPLDVEAEAKRLGCKKSVKYVYRVAMGIILRRVQLQASIALNARFDLRDTRWTN